jgi:hypothetical protein
MEDCSGNLEWNGIDVTCKCGNEYRVGIGDQSKSNAIGGRLKSRKGGSLQE